VHFVGLFLSSGFLVFEGKISEIQCC